MGGKLLYLELIKNTIKTIVEKQNMGAGAV